MSCEFYWKTWYFKIRKQLPLHLNLYFQYINYNAGVGLMTLYFGKSLRSTPIFILWMRYSYFSVDLKECHLLKYHSVKCTLLSCIHTKRAHCLLCGPHH